jgi:SOS-response transcriptional repressor LexA
MIAVMASADPRAKLVNSALQRNGLSFRWLASRLDVSHVSVSSWLNGEARPRDVGVWNSMLQLLRDYESSTKTTETIDVKRAGIRQIPVYPGLSAGGLFDVHSDVDMLELKDWGNGRERWGRVIDGYSMEPVLEPGDIVVFEDRPWEPNHIVHAFDDAQDTVKIAKGSGENVQLVPANPEYPTLDGRKMNIKGVGVVRIRKGKNDEVTTTEYPHGMRYVPTHPESKLPS